MTNLKELAEEIADAVVAVHEKVRVLDSEAGHAVEMSKQIVFCALAEIRQDAHDGKFG